MQKLYISSDLFFTKHKSYQQPNASTRARTISSIGADGVMSTRYFTYSCDGLKDLIEELEARGYDVNHNFSYDEPYKTLGKKQMQKIPSYVDVLSEYPPLN